MVVCAHIDALSQLPFYKNDVSLVHGKNDISITFCNQEYEYGPYTNFSG